MAGLSGRLSVRDHDRDAAGMTYVYPVVSRRSGGVSVGINLNPNHACNWHCAYCQVPELVRGSAPSIDLALLERELKHMIGEILHGDFMRRHVPEDCRTFCDIAISGNGEPTSCRAFDAVVQAVAEQMRLFDLALPLRLITNGSYMARADVQQGLKRLARCYGEVWIKVDAVTDEAIRRINGVSLDARRLHDQVRTCAGLCPSWIQSCMMAWDGEPPSDGEVAAYLDFLKCLKDEQVPLRGVLLYGLARPSLQAEAAHLSALPETWMRRMAVAIEASGWPVRLFL